MRNIAFLCDNFGPIHIDQCAALAKAVNGNQRVFGIELFSKSNVYEWGKWDGKDFEKITLFDSGERERLGIFHAARKIISTCRRNDVGTVLFAHYERPYIFLSALVLRLLGTRSLIMSDSKFDDYTRYLWRELGKSIMMGPYQGGVAASRRCADYLRFLGIRSNGIELNSYAIYPERIRSAAGVAPAPDGTPFEDRNFLCVARLVTKKNHRMLLDAFALYARQVDRPRRLILCGSGPLEVDIRQQIAELDIGHLVDVKGNLTADEVSLQLGRGLCLLLPSIEEQFGIVVLEAQVMGLPVILSDNCGARDLQVRSGVNGYVIEPDNPKGMAFFMRSLSEDEALWRSMAEEAIARGNIAHSDRFAYSVLRLSHLPTPTKRPR